MAAGDAAAVAGLSAQLGYPSTAEAIVRRFRALQRRDDSAIFVVEDADGRLLGWGHVMGRLLLESDPFAELVGLVVDASARRQGVGRSLVEAVEQWARGRGYGILRVRSNSARTLARPFYERLGYAVTKNQNVFEKSLGSRA
jgi:GNAT superfamily N-acetyltransferase